MQSRLEEEEEAKAALMSRIQRLTKLILVSSKNTIPVVGDIPSHQRSHSEDDVSFFSLSILFFQALSLSLSVLSHAHEGTYFCLLAPCFLYFHLKLAN